MQETYRILSIDAWRDVEGGWTWSTWYDVGSIDRDALDALTTPRRILAWLRREGYVTKASAGKVAVYDDGYNIVVVARGTGELLFAIEYGCDV